MFYFNSAMYACLALLLMPAISSATICVPPTGDKNKPADFLVAVADSLTRIKLGRDMPIEALHKKGGGNWGANVLASMKVSTEEYECVHSMLVHFKDSSDEVISVAAKSMLQRVERLIVNNFEMITLFKASLNGEDPSKGKEAGTLAEKEADRSIAVQKAWENIVMGVVGATLSAVDSGSKEAPKTGKLLISSQEKNEIVKRLKAGFKFPMAKKENRAVEVGASRLHKFLTDKWKFRDTKQLSTRIESVPN